VQKPKFCLVCAPSDDPIVDLRVDTAIRKFLLRVDALPRRHIAASCVVSQCSVRANLHDPCQFASQSSLNLVRGTAFRALQVSHHTLDVWFFIIVLIVLIDETPQLHDASSLVPRMFEIDECFKMQVQLASKSKDDHMHEKTKIRKTRTLKIDAG